MAHDVHCHRLGEVQAQALLRHSQDGLVVLAATCRRTQPPAQANRRIYKQRGTTVEPIQGLVKELFELESCWMRGNASNFWLFAAMGVAVQMAQHRAYRRRKSTWNIK